MKIKGMSKENSQLSLMKYQFKKGKRNRRFLWTIQMIKSYVNLVLGLETEIEIAKLANVRANNVAKQ